MAEKRTYRMVPSDKVGYGPGRWVVQYRDAEARVWFDVGDPLSEEDARARLQVMRGEVWTPPPECPECKAGNCGKCTGEAFDPVTGQVEGCGCPVGGVHPKRKRKVR